MAGRIEQAFAKIRAERRPGLVTYTTAGDPDLPRSAEILKALDRAGADVLEVGVPFSDPLADGPVIQRATERALAAGGSLRKSLAMIERLRPHLAAPIVLFSYANPILRVGAEEFARLAAAAGVDGVLALDLPIEEAAAFRETLAAAGIDMVFLLSPTTTDARIRKASELGRGFCTASRAWASPARATALPTGPRRWSGESARRRRCRSRSGSASRARSRSPRSAATRTPPWSAAPWCRSSPKRASRRT